MKLLKVICLLLTVTSGLVLNAFSHDCDIETPAAQTAPITTELEQSANDYVTANLTTTYYTTLSDFDKAIYDAICTSAETYIQSGSNKMIDTNIDFTYYTHDNLLSVARKCLYDHPAYGAFWSGDITIQGSTHVKIVPMDKPSVMLSDEYYKELLPTYSQNAADDQDVARTVFQTMSHHIKYDLKHGTNKHWNNDVAAINEQLSCCQGIAFAYKRFMDAANIPCVVLTTYTNKDEYHMINAIYVDNTWTFVCVTSAICNENNPMRFFQMTQEVLDLIATEIVYIPKM